MSAIIEALNGGAIRASVKVRCFISDEVKRLKQDESGMEIVQAVVLTVISVALGLAVWYFLGNIIAGWMQKVKDDVNSAS